MILAIETSCDDTCAAVLDQEGRRAFSNVIYTQTEHERYGGVVPEVASRAHLERLDAVVERALVDAGTDLDEMSHIAVTVRPGLIGALLVGLSAAKGLAFARELPLVPVNHLEGHVAAAYLADPALEPPFVALIASGGHTALYSVTTGGMDLLGQTLDDAAGEALDKGARMLGLGFPGGPAISKVARAGDPARYDFPVALKEKNNLDFSFSGLKTSLLYRLKALGEESVREELPHLAAAYEAAVVEALGRKLLGAAELYDTPTLVVAGGVAANGSLRSTLAEECERRGRKLVIPPPELCTDNAAMIGAAAASIPAVPYPDSLGLNARSVSRATLVLSPLQAERRTLLRAIRRLLTLDKHSARVSQLVQYSPDVMSGSRVVRDGGERGLPAGRKLARVAYVTFAVAVLLALLKLGGSSGAKPFFLKMVPATPVAKAAQPAAGDGEAPGDETLDLPDADARGTVGRSSIIGSKVSNLPGRQDSARTRKPVRDESPVFYRPSSGEDADGEPVCGNLGDFPESSRVVFPLPGDYFDSYEDTWGAARPQGGHEGTDLMSPTGTLEVAITDGTIVPVKGANENGWNRLGGYTVMLEAAYDAGPIEAGDLFYYAHIEEESALKVGTKVRAGQQIGVVGDTGEGREATRGKFPPHLHFGWYDAGSAGSRTNLESGAMNPYPLLLWLEEYGGSITGGMDVSYCEAPPEEPAPNSSGTTPDLDTGDRNDARPSPIVEQSRDGQPPPEHERKNRTEEEGEGTDEKSKETGATSDTTKASPADSPAKEGGAGDERGERTTPGTVASVPYGDRTSNPSTDGATESEPSQAEIRGKIRALVKDPSPTDSASRRLDVEGLVYMLHKAEKNERDGRDAGVPDKKKHKKPKKRAEPPERKGFRKARSVGEATTQNLRPVIGDAPASKKDREESPDATGSKGREHSESGSR